MNRIRSCLGNPYFAVHPKDKLFVAYFLTFGPISLCYTLLVILPHHSLASPTFFPPYHWAGLAFLYANIYLSFYKVASNSSHTIGSSEGEMGGGDSKKGEEEEVEEWRGRRRRNICGMCLTRSPRTFHCKRCNVCIRKRDHHCMLNGICVGLSNQRYFLSMVFYVAVTSTYFNCQHWPVVAELLARHSTVVMPFCLLAPHLLLLFGIVGPYDFLVFMMALKSFAILCLSYATFVHQASLIGRGQTRYERKIKLPTSGGALVDNFKAVLGRRWFLSWACPLLSSPLPERDFVFRENSKIV